MRFLSALTIQLFFCVCFLSSCKKEIVFEGVEGELRGTAYLSETFTLSDHSGIVVSIEGASSEMKATTDIHGNYSFSGLKTGIYDVIFTKPGFSTFKHYSMQFIGGNIPFYAQNAFLYKLPVTNITELKVDTVRYGFTAVVRLTITVSEPLVTFLRYYMGDTPDVSYTKYLASDLVAFNASYHPTGFQYNVPGSVLAKLPKGKQLYLIAYPGVEGTSYTEITTGNKVYPVNPGKPSARIPFVIPKTN